MSSRLAKLSAMSMPEIVARARAMFIVRMERLEYVARSRRGPHVRPGRSRWDVRRALSRPVARRADWADALLDRCRNRTPLLAALDRGERIRELFAGPYAQEARAIRLQASVVSRHEIEFFGRVFAYGPVINWHADPVSRTEWPRTFFADIPAAAGDVGYGDVKYVWELSRQQYVVDLAKAFFLWRRSEDAREARALIADWMAENPYAFGVNWASPLEQAYRALSWLSVYELCLGDETLPATDHAWWLAGFHDHGRFLFRHLELYSSPYNHLIGEASVLYLLAVRFPELRAAPRWRKRARHVLESRLQEQFYRDGGTVEQATLYHHATLGFYLLAALAGRRFDDPFPHDVWAAIERGTEFSMFMTQPDGTLPPIGDTDDAKPIRFEHRPVWDFRHFLAMGAVLFERPDFKYVAGRFPEDALWLLGTDARDSFERLPSAPPQDRSKTLTSSGYCLLRSDWTSSADYVCFDCGELAGGIRRDDVPSAAHGHADCLAVTMWLAGRPVLIDSGFFAYNAEGQWERHFRQTAAHNTVRIGGRDQARHVKKMAWTRAYRPVLQHWAADDRQASVHGSHDGYRDAGATHHRSVWLRPGGYVVLFDEIEGGEGEAFEVAFHFAEPEVAWRDGELRVSEEFGVRWASAVALEATVAVGGEGPDQGWVAPSLGVRRRAGRLVLRGRVAAITGVLTVVADLHRASVAPLEVQGARVPGGLIVRGADFEDRIVASPGGIRHDPFAATAPLAIWRSQAGRITEVAAIGGEVLSLREGDRLSNDVTTLQATGAR